MYMNDNCCVFRYDIVTDPERWLDVNKLTGDIITRRQLNIQSPHLKNGVYKAVVRATGLWNPSMLFYVVYMLFT